MNLMAGHAGRDRSRHDARRPAYRDPRPRFLIVCEGEITEPQYFSQFAAFSKQAVVKVELARAHGVPLSVVRAARDLKNEANEAARRRDDEFLKFESVWCAIDVDDHHNIPEARILAKDNNIDVAISNACFELWLLLHHQECPGMLHRADAKTKLKEHVPNYDKSVDYRNYAGGYVSAVKRAKSLEKLAESMGEEGRNPTTNVYELTEEIAPSPKEEKAAEPSRPWERIYVVPPPLPPPAS
jgi:RloB-like protein